MTIEEYRAAILQALLDAKNEDGTPAITPREAQEALNGFTDDELQDGILWNSPEDVASIILEGYITEVLFSYQQIRIGAKTLFAGFLLLFPFILPVFSFL